MKKLLTILSEPWINVFEDSGFNWEAAFVFVQNSAADWDEVQQATNTWELGDEIDLDLLAAINIAVTLKWVSGTPAEDVEIFVLGDADGTNYESQLRGNPLSQTVTPPSDANDIVVPFSIMASDYPKCKIGIQNGLVGGSGSGVLLDISVRIKKATIPAAS
jgi:hypothetical protein